MLDSTDSYQAEPQALDAAAIGATTGSLRSWGAFSQHAPGTSSSSQPDGARVLSSGSSRPLDIHSGSSQSRGCINTEASLSSSNRLYSVETSAADTDQVRHMKPCFWTLRSSGTSSATLQT